MDDTPIAIILRGGPADGEVHRDVRADTIVYTRAAKGPDARYVDTGEVDGEGRRVFGHAPAGPPSPAGPPGAAP